MRLVPVQTLPRGSDTPKQLLLRGPRDGRVLRHCTDAEVQADYTATHGASIVGFAFTGLLGFKLLSRLEDIGAVGVLSQR